MLQLVDAGKVSVDDAITKYVPGFRQQVTLRQIMTHTSGIRHYRGEPDNTVHFSSLADAITIFRDDPLLFEPGTKVQYSSYAYNLLAGVIETASGRSLEEYLEKSIFARPRALRKRRWTTTTVSFQTAPDFTSAKPMGCKMRRMWTTASSGLAAGCSLPPKT